MPQKSRLTPAQRTLRASLASNVSWFNTADRTERTAPGRRAAEERFEKLADPDGVLTPAERAEKAARLRAIHYQKMSFKSAVARRQRSGLDDDAA
jgi:hypothetical protein